MSDTPTPTAFTFEGLKAEVLRALAEGGHGDGIVHDGRVIAVKTSPAKNNATAIAVGTAALPPGYRTPAHSHEAEEVSIFLSGSGGAEIDGEVYPVSAGSILVTPSNSVHTTFADEGEPLVVLWLYAPPGSEARWMVKPQA